MAKMAGNPEAGRFSDDQARVLACVLDQIIPPSEDGRFPGAGQAGVATAVDDALRGMPELRAMVVQGLAALDALARQRSKREFAALSAAEQAMVMAELASSEHAFPPILILHAYHGYYSQPRVLEALGLAPRPPHPEGYEMEPNDLSLLERVRQRSRLYREC
jgi:hypothetical protein